MGSVYIGTFSVPSRLFARFFVVVGEEGLKLFFGGVVDMVAAVKSVAAQARPQFVGVFDGFAHGVGGGALGVHLLHPFAQGSLCLLKLGMFRQQRGLLCQQFLICRCLLNTFMLCNISDATKFLPNIFQKLSPL